MSSTAIRALLDEARAAFDRPPDAVEHGPGVEDAALLQLRKACRLLDGAIALLDAGYYTLVVEASFVAIEFRLLERGELQPRSLPGPHPAIYDEAAGVGLFGEDVAADFADLWRDHRARTYYQDGLASSARAERMHALSTEVHAFVVGRSSRGHECICEA